MLDDFLASCTIRAKRPHGRRRTRDFSQGPAWDPATKRWLVDVRRPDGSRRRARFRRERQAQRAWATQQCQIEDGSWRQPACQRVTLAEAFERYREYSRVHHRSYRSSIVPSLRIWEAGLGCKPLFLSAVRAAIAKGKPMIANVGDKMVTTPSKWSWSSATTTCGVRC